MSALDRIVNFGKIVAVLTGLLGVWTFIAKSINDYQAEIESANREVIFANSIQNADAREWSKVTIFKILIQTGPVSFDGLYSRFQLEGVPIESVSRANLSKDSVWRVLLELSYSGLVYFQSDGLVALNTRKEVDATVAMASSIESQDKGKRNDLILYTFIADKVNNPKAMYSIEDLATLAAATLSVDRQVVIDRLQVDLAQGILLEDGRGRLFNPGNTRISEFITNVVRANPNLFTSMEVAEAGSKSLQLDKDAFIARIEHSIALGRLSKDSSERLSFPNVP